MTIKKTLAIVLAAGAVASAAQAKNGFYVGGDLGYTRTNLGDKVKVTNNGQTGNAKVKKSTNNTDLAVRLGYMANINNFLIGAETGLGYIFNDVTRNATVNVGGANALVKTKFERGLTSDLIAKLGMKFGKTSVYGLGGVTFSQFKMKNTFTLSQAGVASATAKSSKSKTLTGSTFGGGFAYDITEKVAIKAEYRHTNYGRMSKTTGVRFNGQNSSAKTSIKPTTHSFLTGVVYSF